MDVKVKYECIERYLPIPRCRKYREREAEKECVVSVQEVPFDELAPAFDVEKYMWDPDMHIEENRIYAHGNCLWTLSRYSRYHAQKSWYDLTPCTAEFLSRQLIPSRYEIRDFQSDTDRIEAFIQQKADEFLISDGQLYEQANEPMYAIFTFGLGNNHASTALMIENSYNHNIPSSRYFAANQREEAIAKAKGIALARGDTESIQDIEEALEIHVHDNKYVKENPQSWNFEGNPFLNKLEKMTEAANDPLVAGLLVIGATYKENLNHGR